MANNQLCFLYFCHHAVFGRGVDNRWFRVRVRFAISSSSCYLFSFFWTVWPPVIIFHEWFFILHNVNHIFEETKHKPCIFSSSRCVRQGDNLSPSLFNIFINDIPDTIKHWAPHKFHNIPLSCLTYADDLRTRTRESKVSNFMSNVTNVEFAYHFLLGWIFVTFLNVYLLFKSIPLFSIKTISEKSTEKGKQIATRTRYCNSNSNSTIIHTPMIKM